MQSIKATGDLISPYLKNMQQALQDVPELNNTTVLEWKRGVVRVCNLYLNQFHEDYNKLSVLAKGFKFITGVFVGKSYTEYDLMQSFKTELEKSENIDKCYSTILEYSDSSAGGDRSEQNSSVKQIFDKLSQSVVKDKSPASVLFAGSTTSAGRGGTVAPLSGTMESGHDVCRNTSSSTTGGNTITESNAGFQNDSGKEADEQSGEISWSGNRFDLKGSYESCVDVGTRKLEQQDRLIPPYIVGRGPLKGHIFAASFDGHGRAGGNVASQVAARFSKEAMSKITDGVSSDTRLSDTFFKELGESKESAHKAEWETSGSTMSLLQITPEGKLHTYTLGDSRTMLFQNGKCKFSTIDMSAHDCQKAYDTAKEMRETEYGKMKKQIALDLASDNERHKHFTTKYAALSADSLADIYYYHCKKYNELKEAKRPVVNFGNRGYRVGSSQRVAGDGVVLAISSGWGCFGEVKGRFSPLVQTFDLKKLDAGAPLQILIGSDGIMDPFNADQMANYLKEDLNHDLKDKLVKLISNGKTGTSSTKASRDNISLTLMELKMSMSDK